MPSIAQDRADRRHCLELRASYSIAASSNRRPHTISSSSRTQIRQDGERVSLRYKIQKGQELMQTDGHPSLVFSSLRSSALQHGSSHLRAKTRRTSTVFYPPILHSMRCTSHACSTYNTCTLNATTTPSTRRHYSGIGSRRTHNRLETMTPHLLS